MNSWIQRVKNGWTEANAEKGFVRRFVVQFGVYFAIYILVSRFLVYNRLREGTVLHDPIMLFFQTVDFSVPIFFFTYTASLAFIWYMLPYPRMILPMARAFLTVFVLRALFIYLVPLHPPADMILLNDPFIDNVLGFKNEVVNDLFFSGHIADLSFFVFCCRSRSVRYYLLLALVLVSAMLVWQKVHYTADVMAAPFFAYVCYSILAKKHVDRYAGLPDQ